MQFLEHTKFYLPILLIAVLSACEPPREELLQDARGHLDARDAEAAQQMYLRLLEKNGQDVDAIAGLIEVALIQNVTQPLIDWSERLLQFRPMDRQANVVVGQKLLHEGLYADALIRFLLAFEQSEFKLEKQEAQRWIQFTQHKVLQQEQETERKEAGQND
ncbi:MAG: hypothetical protein ACOX5R_07540 [bacterium]|jgi:hypothetical protein